MRVKEDDMDILNDQVNIVPQPEAMYGYKLPGFSTTLALIPSKLPYNKAVVIVKLNNLKTSYGVRISWSGIH